MAVEIELHETVALVQKHLPDHARYRCLVIQGKDMSVLATVAEHVVASAETLGCTFEELDALQQFDTIGALSCDAVIENIKSIAFKKRLLISGPLHFLDYWSPAVRSVFWKFLAAFSNGPGIIVTDAFRNEAVLGPLRTVEGFARPDLRCLKSRLESTQDRLA
jgi:hypothetical protein